jgi:hypothetical protein
LAQGSALCLLSFGLCPIEKKEKLVRLEETGPLQRTAAAFFICRSRLLGKSLPGFKVLHNIIDQKKELAAGIAIQLLNIFNPLDPRWREAAT